MNNKIIAACATFLFLATCFTVCTQNADATYEENYGKVYEIDLAPGFTYTYTPKYPGDLTVTTTLDKYESSGITASVSNGTVTISVKNGVTSGSYDAIVKATTNTAGITQTAYQHIRINVVQGLSVSGSVNNIILGQSVNFTPNGTSAMGQVTWKVKDGTTLPSGLVLSNGKITGTPTKVGMHTISLTATAKGETKDLVINFTAYNVIKDNADETIFSHGNNVSSTKINQTGNDLNVTWRVKSGTMPSGFTLSANTGVISGKSTELKTTVITIEGTTGSDITPKQTVEKKITIISENDIELTAGPGSTGALLTFPGAGDRYLQMDTITGTSAVTWSVSGLTGVSIDQNGKITYKDTTPTGKFTVTATTANKQTESKEINIRNEAKGAITGESSISCIAGNSVSVVYTCNVSGTWSVDKSSVPSDVTITLDNGKLTLSSQKACNAFDVKIILTTKAGQTMSKTVTCHIVNGLIFTTVPTNGAIAYEV